MAIDLPPVIPPQPMAVAQIQTHASRSDAEPVIAQIGAQRVQVSGNRYLAPTQLDELLAAAETPAQFINALNQAYYQLGHLLVTVYFAQLGDQVFVHVVNGQLDNIKAPPEIRTYFKSLIGDQDLERAEFDRQRVLANLASERHQTDYRTSYQVGVVPESFTLVMSPSEKADYDATEFALSFNNFGNRFVGRYFAGVSLKHDFAAGPQVALAYDRAMTEWGEVSGGDYYNAINAKVNMPTPMGLYAVEARQVNYAREVDVETLVLGGLTDCNGVLFLLCDLLGASGDELLAGEPGTTDLKSDDSLLALSGEQVLASDLLYRFTFFQRLEYIDNTIDADGFGTLLDEPQLTLELRAKYNQLFHFFSRPSRLSAELSLKSGFEDGGTLNSEADEGQVSLGRRQGEFLLLRPSLSFQLGLRDWLNFELDWRSQISDGVQLPLHQQFFLGGSNGLSAYLPGVLLGDTGHYGKFALTGNGLRLWGLSITPSVFVEYGQAKYENASSAAGDVRSLGDAGMMLALAYRDTLKSELIAATPIHDKNIPAASLAAAEVDFFWRVSLLF